MTHWVGLWGNLQTKSNSWRTKTKTKEAISTGTGPSIHSIKGTATQRTLLPTKAKVNPLSNMVCVYPPDKNSPYAFIRKLASIRNPIDIELNRKLITKQIDVDPYFKTNVLSDLEPKNPLLKRWLAL